MKTIRIATRESPLALCQAEIVRSALQKHHPEIAIEIVGMTTSGDQNLVTTLSEIGGKAVFVKELEQSLLNMETDIAVHSMKDVPAELPDELSIVAMMERDDPRDAMVSHQYRSLDDLPTGAVVGTSSLRRQAQIKRNYPHLQIEALRGNVGTRLNKLKDGKYDAIILACAGLKRLQIDGYVPLPIEICVPAIGQGAIGIECLSKHQQLHRLISVLNDDETNQCVTAERAVSCALGADCQMPLAAYATINDGQMYIQALFGDIGNNELLHAQKSGDISHAKTLGEQVAQQLIDQGARTIIQKIQSNDES